MKAVILVGGQGTRLRPLTLHLPKPMVPIVNRPFLEHMLDYLKGHGVREVILTLCYLPERIQAHFGDGQDFGVKLTYVMEDIPLGTAGAVKNVAHLLDDTFLVFNGDVFTDLDLGQMLSCHLKSHARATIALTRVDDPTAYGVVETDHTGQVRQFVEKPGPEAVNTNFINAGAYVLEPDVLDLVPAGVPVMIERKIFPLLLERGDLVMGFKSRAYWIDIGTPQAYLELHRNLLSGEVAWNPPGRLEGRGFWVGDGCHVDPSAEVVGPVVLGDKCTIGPQARLHGPAILGHGCQVEENATVQGAVLWAGAKVGRGATLRNCVLGKDASVGEGCWVLDGSVLGDRATVERGNRLERGVRVWPDKRLEPNTLSF